MEMRRRVRRSNLTLGWLLWYWTLALIVVGCTAVNVRRVIEFQPIAVPDSSATSLRGE